MLSSKMRHAAAAAPALLRSFLSTEVTTTSSPHLQPAFRVFPFSTNTATAAPSSELADLTHKMDSALRARQFSHALSLFDSAEQRVLVPASAADPRSAAAAYDRALRACAGAGQAQRAQRIVGAMWRRGVPVGRVAQGSLLKALCAAGRREEAFKHLKAIPASRVTPTLCNALLSACAAAKDVPTGLRVWDLMQRRRLQPDAVSWCEILRLHGAAGNPTAVRAAWEEAQHAAALESDQSTRIMVAAAAAAALATAGDITAGTEGCETLMEALGDALPVQLDLNEAVASGIGPESTSASRSRAASTPLEHLRAACNTVLHTALAAGQWGAMRHLVALMTRHGLPPDAITFNVLLKAAMWQGDGPVALHEGIAEMRALGLRPTTTTYALLIDAHAHHNDVAGAVEAFKAGSAALGGMLDVAAWNALVRAYAGTGDLQALLRNFIAMSDSLGPGEFAVGQAVPPPPDATTFVACLEAAAYAVRRAGDGRDDEGCQVTRRAAEEVVHAVESAMLHSNSNNLSSQRADAQRSLRAAGDAAVAALVKAHATLGHTTSVWSILLDVYGPKSAFSGKGNRKDANEDERGESEIEEELAGFSLPPHPAPSVSGSLEDAILGELASLAAAEAAEEQSSCHRHSHRKSVQALNAGMPALARTGRMDLVLRVLRMLGSAGAVPDHETYAVLIAACAAPPRPGLAKRLLAGMEVAGLTPHTRAYNSFLKVECVRAGVVAADDVVAQMTTAGVAPDAATWKALRACALSHGRPDVAADAEAHLWELRSGGGSGGSFHAAAEAAATEVAAGVDSEAAEKEGQEKAAVDQQKHWAGYYASEDEEEW